MCFTITGSALFLCDRIRRLKPADLSRASSSRCLCGMLHLSKFRTDYLNESHIWIPLQSKKNPQGISYHGLGCCAGPFPPQCELNKLFCVEVAYAQHFCLHDEKGTLNRSKHWEDTCHENWQFTWKEEKALLSARVIPCFCPSMLLPSLHALLFRGSCIVGKPTLQLACLSFTCLPTP